MNPPAKLLLALEMLIGRLEIYPILIFLAAFLSHARRHRRSKD